MNQLRELIWIKNICFFPAGFVLIQISCQLIQQHPQKEWAVLGQERFCEELFQLGNNTKMIKLVIQSRT